ncbi:MAG: hypothetical protein FWE54_05315 [Methanimicrococcus sp.]|nr:hypothetical protein [Methanimicrococcus sp.]
MKTENKIVIILFIMAFSTVFLLYSMIDSSDNGFSPAGETPVIPTNADIGKTVYVEGTVLSKRMTYTGENLILNIECSDRTGGGTSSMASGGTSSMASGGTGSMAGGGTGSMTGSGTVLMIFVPRSAGAGEVNRRIEKDDVIGVKGVVTEYNGTLEVIPKNENYIVKLKE